MFDYVTDKVFLMKMKGECADIVNRLKMKINAGDFLKVEVNLVGSGSRGLITQDGEKPVDLDYNLCIKKINGNLNDGQKIKNYVMQELNEVLQSKNLKNCSDSTSALTTKLMTVNGFKTQFKIDLAIIRLDQNGWYRLIHKKTGDTKKDSWIWNQGPNSKGFSERADWIKTHNHIEEFKKVYLDKKKRYLTKQDDNHSSFNCYIEAVNEVYSAYNNPNGAREKAPTRKTVECELLLNYSGNSKNSFYCGYKLKDGTLRRSPDINSNTDEKYNFKLLMHWLNKMVSAVGKDSDVRSITVSVSKYIHKLISQYKNEDLYSSFSGRLRKMDISIKYKIE